MLFLPIILIIRIIFRLFSLLMISSSFSFLFVFVFFFVIFVCVLLLCVVVWCRLLRFLCVL